jgi:hypothetical protein
MKELHGQEDSLHRIAVKKRTVNEAVVGYFRATVPTYRADTVCPNADSCRRSRLSDTSEVIYRSANLRGVSSRTNVVAYNYITKRTETI